MDPDSYSYQCSKSISNTIHAANTSAKTAAECAVVRAQEYAGTDSIQCVPAAALVLLSAKVSLIAIDPVNILVLSYPSWVA